MTFDTAITLGIIAIAFVYVARTFWAKKKKSGCCGCGGGCGSIGTMKQGAQPSCPNEQS